MEAFLWSAAIVALILLALAAPRWRLKRVLARAIAPAWVGILERNIPVYGHMPLALRDQLNKLVQQFLHQKKFVGCDGLVIDDEIRVTIAGQACLLLLNRYTRVYPKLQMVLVYPTAFRVPGQQGNPGDPDSMHAPEVRLGESWGDGRVILSWDHVVRGAHDWSDGQNVVLHEFAHQLDSESGSNNGAPFLGHPGSYSSWSAVLARDFAHLRQEALFRQQGVMDHYGATSPAEFFAVATETFFEKPWQLAERHAALFEQFQAYYRVDPRAWIAMPPLSSSPVPEQAGHADAGNAYGQWQ